MKIFRVIIIACVSACVASCAPQQGAVIRKKSNGFELRVDGEVSYIKGVGKQTVWMLLRHRVQMRVVLGAVM